MTSLVQTNKGSAKRRGKAYRRQREVRRLTLFVDYRLMFDSSSRRSFRIEFGLIRSPAYLKSLLELLLARLYVQRAFYTL